jgi:mono/diheme cytochrome c family protein
MKRMCIGSAFLLLALIAAGCGKKADESASSGATTQGGASPVSGAPAVSAYDAGPRAGEGAINETLAKEGEGLFQTKGCSACHGFGKRISCPDLNGVTMRRTHEWMKQQILHPEVMTKQDPIARQLFAQYSLQMPNQGLTEPQALAVIEFLKHKNHETAETAK